MPQCIFQRKSPVLSDVRYRQADEYATSSIAYTVRRQSVGPEKSPQCGDNVCCFRSWTVWGALAVNAEAVF